MGGTWVRLFIARSRGWRWNRRRLLTPRFTIRLCASSFYCAEAGGRHGFVLAFFGSGEQSHGSCQRKSHDVEVAAFYARNPTGGIALDAVGTGFVHRLAAHQV